MSELELVGRGAELAVLGTTLDRAARAQPTAVALIGEPGIGKTILLTELGRMADARGMLVLAGGASEFESDMPFWLFVDALDEYVRGLPPTRLSALDDDVHAELGHVLPSWSASAGQPRSSADQRYRTHTAMRNLLELLAATSPLVLLLDDLHWADSGSIELLCALLRRPPAAPVLIGMAFRPRQVPPRLVAGLDRGVTRLELGGLSLDGSLRLLGPGWDRSRATALHDESGGNPFYLSQLARTPVTQRPQGVAAALAAEIALLDDDVRRALEGAAVAGDPFVPELAAAAAGLSEAAMTTAIDGLLRRDLVRPTDVPRRFRFRHPLVRRAVYDAAPGGWRLSAHERAAHALAAAGAPAVSRAHHVVASARAGDAAAVEVLAAAGAAAADRAPAEAARWYRAALDLVPETAPDRLPLAIAHAGALAAAGHLADAAEVLTRCLGLVSDVATRVRLTAQCAGVELTLGRHETAHRRLVACLDELPEQGTAEGVALMCALAQDGIYRFEYAAARDWAERARVAARLLADPLPAATAVGWTAACCAFGGDVETSGAACTELAAVVDGLSDEELGRSPDLAVNLASAELLIDRYAQASQHIERALAVARAHGRDHHFPALFWTGLVRVARGRLPDAVALLDEAVEIARSTGRSSMLGWMLLARSTAATAAGDTETALDAAQESVDAMAGPGLSAAWAALAHADALLAVGDAERAVQELTTVAALPVPLRCRAFEVLTGCAIARHRPADAERAAAACAQVSDLGSARAVAARAGAVVALHQGDAPRAVELALAAAAGFAATPLDEAQARMVASRALATAGRLEHAAAEAERAAATFDHCGAPARRAAAERELRRLGHRRLHRRSRPGTGDVGVSALTERELQVARMIIDRRTNAEIAAALFLSPKTVESHIRNLFHKLSVSSRVEVARAVERAVQ